MQQRLPSGRTTARGAASASPAGAAGGDLLGVDPRKKLERREQFVREHSELSAGVVQSCSPEASGIDARIVSESTLYGARRRSRPGEMISPWVQQALHSRFDPTPRGNCVEVEESRRKQRDEVSAQLSTDERAHQARTRRGARHRPREAAQLDEQPLAHASTHLWARQRGRRRPHARGHGGAFAGGAVAKPVLVVPVPAGVHLVSRSVVSRGARCAAPAQPSLKR